VSPGAASPPFRSLTVLVEVDRFEPSTVAVSVELLLPVLSSKVPAAVIVAVLATVTFCAVLAGPNTPLPTATVSSSGGSDCPGSRKPVFGCAQDTTCPTALQLQPVPVPETKVSPAGNVSLSVMG